MPAVPVAFSAVATAPALVVMSPVSAGIRAAGTAPLVRLFALRVVTAVAATPAASKALVAE